MLNISFGLSLALNTVLTVIHLAGITLTLFRFCYRKSIQRLWWDDFLSLFAMILDGPYIAVLWFDYADGDSILSTHKARVVRYWLGLMLFTLVVWSIRISLALAIARIWPPRDPTRIFAIGMAFLYVVFCTTVVIRSIALCAHQPSLVSGPEAACHWSLDLQILVVVANIFSDALLVAVPLFKLWRVRLDPQKRRLILGAFTASSCTTAASLLCAVFQFTSETLEPAKTILITKFLYFETGVSLIVCNLLVVVTYLHTRTRVQSSDSGSSSGGCSPSPESYSGDQSSNEESNDASSASMNRVSLTEISVESTWRQSSTSQRTR